MIRVAARRSALVHGEKITSSILHSFKVSTRFAKSAIGATLVDADLTDASEGEETRRGTSAVASAYLVVTRMALIASSASES